MNENNKAAGCGDTQADQQNICSSNSNQIAIALKAAIFRLAEWLSVIGGAIC